jgi:hypothetical protein
VIVASAKGARATPAARLPVAVTGGRTTVTAVPADRRTTADPAAGGHEATLVTIDLAGRAPTGTATRPNVNMVARPAGSRVRGGSHQVGGGTTRGAVSVRSVVTVNRVGGGTMIGAVSVRSVVTVNRVGGGTTRGAVSVRSVVTVNRVGGGTMIGAVSVRSVVTVNRVGDATMIGAVSVRSVVTVNRVGDATMTGAVSEPSVVTARQVGDATTKAAENDRSAVTEKAPAARRIGGTSQAASAVSTRVGGISLIAPPGQTRKDVPPKGAPQGAGQRPAAVLDGPRPTVNETGSGETGRVTVPVLIAHMATAGGPVVVAGSAASHPSAARGAAPAKTTRPARRTIGPTYGRSRTTGSSGRIDRQIRRCRPM